MSDLLAAASYAVMFLVGSYLGWRAAINHHEHCVEAAFASGVEMGMRQAREERQRAEEMARRLNVH